MALQAASRQSRYRLSIIEIAQALCADIVAVICDHLGIGDLLGCDRWRAVEGADVSPAELGKQRQKCLRKTEGMGPQDKAPTMDVELFHTLARTRILLPSATMSIGVALWLYFALAARHQAAMSSGPSWVWPSSATRASGAKAAARARASLAEAEVGDFRATVQRNLDLFAARGLVRGDHGVGTVQGVGCARVMGKAGEASSAQLDHQLCSVGSAF